MNILPTLYNSVTDSLFYDFGIFVRVAENTKKVTKVGLFFDSQAKQNTT